MSKLCPLLKEPCIEHGCRFYVHLIGNNPQTGKPEDRFDCTFAFLPILLVENAQQQRQTGAAVESLRNETVNGNQALATAFLKAAGAATARPAGLRDITPQAGALDLKGG